jgi:NADP-dependent 3-hydroxy acid dehydrogenase YdfG
VGHGVTAALLSCGYRVVGVARNESGLSRLGEEFFQTSRFSSIVADVSSEEGAAHLAEALRAARPDVIIDALNAASAPSSVFEVSAEVVEKALRENVIAHFAAAKHLIPTLGPGGMYLGLGGGMVDLVIAGNAANSMVQAAQRALFNYLDREKHAAVQVRELVIYSMILPGREVSATEPYRLTAYEVGQHIGAIIAQPAAFTGPILALKSRKQLGLGERA